MANKRCIQCCFWFTMGALILACLTGPSSAEEVRKCSLPNGLKVLLRENHSIPVVSVFITYLVGSRNEQLGHTGISHLLEHMLFRGTAKYPPGRISRALDVAGADFNAYTTCDITSYYETLPTRYLSLALDIEADRMAHCTLDPFLVAQEKKVVLAELDGYDNSPRETLYNEVLGLHFTAHPYHWPVGGYKHDVQGITRDDLYRHYRIYYTPGNAVLTLVGDFQAPAALELVKRSFGSIPAGKTAPPIRSVEPPQQGEKRTVISRRGNTSYIKVAFHTPSIKDKGIYPLALMNTLLAEGKSSRLYRALVEKGLAASVSSSLWENTDPGLYSITVTLAPGKEHREAEAALFSELARFGETPVSDAELKKAANLEKAEFYRTRESLTLQAEYLSLYEAVFSYRYLETYMEKLHQVSPLDVQNAARKYLSATNRTIGWFRATGEGDSPGNSAQPESHGRYCAGPGEAKKENGLLLSTGKESSTKGFSFSRSILPNGLTLIIKENHATPTVSIGGYVRAGSIHDPSGKEGLANFTASMLDRGTTSINSREIADTLDSLGSRLHLSGGRETTTIEGWSLAENLDETLAILASELMDPAFPAEEQEKVRNQIASQLAQQADDPQSQALMALRELIYPAGHPYRSNPRGYRETLASLTGGDLAAFHRARYRPDTTVLCIVGDVNGEDTKKMADHRFASWKREGKAPEPVISPVSLPGEVQKRIIPMKDKSQVAVALGNRALSRSSRDYYAFMLLNDILGGNTLTSRLGAKLREKEGLVYGVWSYLVDGQGEAPWVILYGTGEKNVAKSLEEVKAAVQAMQNSPVSDEELNRGRSAIVNRLAVSLQTNENVASTLSDMEYFNLGADYLERLPRLYGAVTGDDLQRVARQYMRLNTMSLVIAGPWKEQ